MNVIDLFAGCGGMSLGFRMSGYKSILANEFDEWAAETYAKNNINTPLLIEDIRKATDLKILQTKYGLRKVQGIIGGPPCQGFSLSGNRDKKDPRNSLFMEFVRFVKYFEPEFFVMENVKGILSMHTEDGSKVVDIIMDEFTTAGYKTSYAVLNAANYGVPQLRERVFFIGLKSKFPYDKNKLFPKPKFNINNYVTVEQAIMDLPQLTAGKGTEYLEYENKPLNAYQRLMREDSKGVYNHFAMRHTQRLIERFKIIKYGESVKDVPYEHSALKRGDPKIKSGKVFSQNNMRVHPNRPNPTLAASFQSNFIHPYLDRNFTAREGARIQSFPDNYIFCGKRTTMSWEKNLSQYQQIGNAVPPLLAKAIAENIIEYFNNVNEIADRYEQARSNEYRNLQIVQPSLF